MIFYAYSARSSVIRVDLRFIASLAFSPFSKLFGRTTQETLLTYSLTVANVKFYRAPRKVFLEKFSSTFSTTRISPASGYRDAMPYYR